MANITPGGSNSEADYYGTGYLEKQDQAASATLTSAANTGYVQTFNTTGVTLTLPAAAVGLAFKFRVGTPGITVKIKPASTETMTGLGLTATASYILTLTNAPAGSYLELTAQSGNWNITAANLGGQGDSGVLTYAAT
jgi:hypothetical protein